MTTRFDTYGIQALEHFIQDQGLPRFRAMQILEWVYGKGITSYEEMTNLSLALRKQLADTLPLQMPTIADKRVSSDGTRKYVLQLADGGLVETVGIPSRDYGSDGQPRRLTVCFSTQVGCPMGCDFCATGKEGFSRNLTPGEMAWQLVEVGRDFDMRVSGAVAMGQGEPFLNYVNLLDALRIINHERLLGIGARHITVSTCGILDGISRFGKEVEQFTLALSLHAARQDVRDRLMPGMRGVSLEAIKEALQVYITYSGRRISLEYLMIKGANDSTDDLKALLDFCRDIHAHVNLLPINRVADSPYTPCSPATIKTWEQALDEAGVECSIRDSRGSDIEAACGQLKNTLTSST